MGGHGGLNILPQKRWNVYNFDNREKVKNDEEAAARDEQLKREQAQRRDAELRLERLRTSRGLAPLKPATEDIVKEKEKEKENEKEAEEVTEEPVESEAKTGHINLFEGIKIFDPIETPKKERHVERDDPRRKKMKKEEPRVVAPEDEKYRLGYGVAGKGVKLPWYLERRDGDKEGNDGSTRDQQDESKQKSGKKTLQELREERLKREKKEKERERQLIVEKTRKDGGFSRRRDLRDDRFSRRR